jgi:Glycosyl transferase family 2
MRHDVTSRTWPQPPESLQPRPSDDFACRTNFDRRSAVAGQSTERKPIRRSSSPRRSWMKRLRPVQKAVVLLNFRPFTYLFGQIYQLGLRTLVRVVARHPAVRSILGYGSFFEGRCLYGVSDIDVVIVIDERFSRTDGVHQQIVLDYKRVRRLFPFLADWSESAENLIFLSDVRAGFPVPESVRLRLKQGRLVLLHGAPLELELTPGPLSLSEAVAEVDSLLRIVLMKGEVHSSNVLFWKKNFLKLESLAKAIGLHELAADIAEHPGLRCMRANDMLLFARKSDPDSLFELLLEFSSRLFAEVQTREEPITLRYTLLTGSLDAAAGVPNNGRFSGALASISREPGVRVKMLPSPLYGLTPRLSYFPLDQDIPVLQLERPGFQALRKLARTLAEQGDSSEGFLVPVKNVVFLLRKRSTYSDIVPLDPLIYANLYARLFDSPESFQMPRAVYAEQAAAAARMLTAFAGLYGTHEGWVAKLPFPCIYSEDDLLVMNDAFHRIRVFLLHTEGVDIGSMSTLVDFLGRKYPGCEPFLQALPGYYQRLAGEDGRGAGGINLYRCLLQFMSQALTGATTPVIPAWDKRLGISVGIITRNRAADLQEALESLRLQIRPADEIVIVDNGSTDATREVVERFRDRLPISYYHLDAASIPNARNLVIAKAAHEIVAFTDDDCIVEPEWLEAVERGFLRADNVGIVGGWVKHEPAPEASMIDTYYSLFHHNKT